MNQEDWQFPGNLQPDPASIDFKLDACLNSVVSLRAEIPEDGFTADTLGTSRQGNGVLINSTGLILTIGYLITEAETIWLSTNQGESVPGTVVAYDQVTGFGFVQALGTLRNIEPIPVGSAKNLSVGEDLLVVGHGGRKRTLRANMVSKHCFTGYWEYFLEEAIFTSPVHPQWGGAGIVNGRGELVAIGSLLTEEITAEGAMQTNMAVPIDLVFPLLENLKNGLPPREHTRPWLGIYATDNNGQTVVVGLAKNGPAETALIQPKDVVLEVEGESVNSLADFLKKVWAIGTAGSNISLKILRNDKTLNLLVKSADRNDFLKKPSLH